MKTTVKLAGLKIAGGLATVAMHGLLVRQIGDADYGNFALFQTTIIVLCMLANGGWMHGIVLLISRYGFRRRWALYKGAVLQGFFSAFAISILAGVPLYLLASEVFSDPQQVAAFRLGLAVVPFQATLLVAKGVLRGLQKPAISIFPDEVLLPLLGAIGLAVFTFAGFWEAGVSFAIGSAAVTLLGVSWSWFSVPEEARNASAQFLPIRWTIYVFPLVAGEIGNMVISRGDIFMLAALSSPAETARYAMATRLGSALLLVQSLILPLYAGRFSTAFTQRDRLLSRRLLMQSSMMAGGFAFLPAIVLIFYPQLAQIIFGPAVLNALTPIRIIAIAYLFHTATGPLSLFAQMHGKHYAYSIISIFAAAVNIVLNFFLVPQYGAVGAALTTLAVFAVWKVILLFLVFYVWSDDLIGRVHSDRE